MSSQARAPGCIPLEVMAAFANGSLSAPQASSCADHLAGCEDCQGEFESVRSVAHVMQFWPVEVLQPAASVWERLAAKIAPNSQARHLPPLADHETWAQVSEGISCKVLAVDHRNHRLSMLVRLKPGTYYPPHEHADAEELHLLDGELWINERKLLAGDYNRAEPGSVDARVFSETGCTCVLVTSSRDRLIV